MFIVYHSNSVESLKILLVNLIKNAPLSNPFDKEHILVQSLGISQWLKIELAKELGVAANIHFSLPSAYIWEMFTQFLPYVPKYSAFSREAITWKLMSILPSVLGNSEFDAVRRYLKEDDNACKVYQLSEKIADIFDRYMIYRPEWIISWEQNIPVLELDGEHFWQSILWRKLCQHTLNQGQLHYHRANLYSSFIKKIMNDPIDISSLPNRLFVFSIASFPPYYLDTLKALGKHIDVHLMFNNPCRYYWGDIRDRKYLTKKSYEHCDNQGVHFHRESSRFKKTSKNIWTHSDGLHMQHAVGNSLLASMGKLGRDSLYFLSQVETEGYDFFIDIERDTLLHHIQADILNLEEHQNDQQLDSSHHKKVIKLGDFSLSVHVCHTPMREIEVLHDRLLTIFDSESTIKPRDIVVMVADINSYAPLIQAVFASASSKHYIPYSISDHNAKKENPILSVFMQLITLPNMRCLASELLALLEIPVIMKKFQIDEDEFLIIQKWVRETGIRWGLDSEMAREFDLPVSEENTWKFGIARMLLGYAMSESSGLFNLAGTLVSPYDEVQCTEVKLVGKLSYFIEKINLYRRLLSQTQSIDSWCRVISNLLNDFFSVGLEEEIALQLIRDSIGQLKEQINHAAYQQDITPIIIIQYLEKKFSSEHISQHFLTGQVNFCTMIPMCSIPFKVVCLLGMNDGVYPRSVPPESFDLMIGRTKHGDRSRRDEDCYLFLEAIRSAQQVFYVSYVGRSIQDNTECFPSVLVSELMDYCCQNYCLKGTEALSSDDSAVKLLQSLVFQYGIAAFSPSSFTGRTGSYVKEWIPAVRVQVQKGERVEDNQKRSFSEPLFGVTYLLELNLLELQKFWFLPVQYFFNRRLNIKLDPVLSIVEDDEPFSLSALESYRMRTELLDTLFKKWSETHSRFFDEDRVVLEFMKRQRAQGRLPPGVYGDIEFEINRMQVQVLLNTVMCLCDFKQEDINVNIILDISRNGKSVHLTGRIKQNYQFCLVRYRTGKIRSQDYLSAWIDHLVMSTIGYSKSTHIVGYDRKNGLEHFIYPRIDDLTQAKSLLEELICLFYQGISQPLAYFPRTALMGIEAGFHRGCWVNDERKSLKKMADTFNDSYASIGEGSNVYIARVWPKWNSELAVQARSLSNLVIKTPRLMKKNIDDIK
ncbi:exodeoxyribonuclease V gamma chain [Candidatus Photodesmus blepharus]|uniref:RecBCD enzyme subunit RecC n=1 Tax=Candidatus Photodesmus blepharonis TaxID=1179155 RepID=A0A084CP29_9GAMM|nr:exodeoxyribonuclease V subunit gamma [Candidatus Photodesmus blepharus]KEY91558.1 exodeoxyribonuclease V gamma chain [Candidatus Photodesmus blepharus]